MFFDTWWLKSIEANPLIETKPIFLIILRLLNKSFIELHKHLHTKMFFK